jgi:hypothetical protein
MKIFDNTSCTAVYENAPMKNYNDNSCTAINEKAPIKKKKL